MYNMTSMGEFCRAVRLYWPRYSQHWAVCYVPMLTGARRSAILWNGCVSVIEVVGHLQTVSWNEKHVSWLVRDLGTVLCEHSYGYIYSIQDRKWKQTHYSVLSHEYRDSLTTSDMSLLLKKKRVVNKTGMYGRLRSNMHKCWTIGPLQR